MLEDSSLLGCNAVLTGNKILTFGRSMLPPSLEYSDPRTEVSWTAIPWRRNTMLPRMSVIQYQLVGHNIS